MANEFRVRKGLIVNGSGSVILDIQGSQGQLFSVTDQLSGSLFSVKDISGIPVMEAFSNNVVRMGKFGEKALFVSESVVGIGVENVTSKLHISSSTGGVLQVDGVGSTTALYVSASGKVGINTTNADNTYQGLTIFGTDPSLRLKTNSTAGWNWIETVNSSGVNNISFGVNNSIGGYFGVKMGPGLDSPEFIIVSGSGNVGINTTSPNLAKLQVGGNVYANSFTGSLQGTASFATTASFALNAAGGSSFPYTGSAIISGSLQVTGSSSILGSGSRIFTISGSTGGLLEINDGGASDVFSISSGSVEILRIDNTKAVSISGSLIVTGSITGSLLGTASYATQALSSSYATQALSSSYAITASYALNAGAGGSGGGTTYPVTTAGISIADPTSAEDVTLLYTSASIVVAAVEGVLRGSAGPTASINLRYGNDRNASGSLIVSASNIISTTTGNNLTLTANTTVPAANFIWLETTAITGTVNELFVGVLFASGSV